MVALENRFKILLGIFVGHINFILAILFYIGGLTSSSTLSAATPDLAKLDHPSLISAHKCQTTRADHDPCNKHEETIEAEQHEESQARKTWHLCPLPPKINQLYSLTSIPTEILLDKSNSFTDYSASSPRAPPIS